MSETIHCPRCDEHDKTVIIYVLGLLEDMVDSGLIAGSKVLTEEGKASLLEIRKSGFKPTTEELERCVRGLSFPHDRV